MQEEAALLAIESRYRSLSVLMDERMRRQWAAAESRAYGWGGVRAVGSVIGMSPNTIRDASSYHHADRIHSAQAATPGGRPCRAQRGSGPRLQRQTGGGGAGRIQCSGAGCGAELQGPHKGRIRTARRACVQHTRGAKQRPGCRRPCRHQGRADCDVPATAAVVAGQRRQLSDLGGLFVSPSQFEFSRSDQQNPPIV